MSSSAVFCRSGRCGDFSSKAVGLPSLAAIDVVERILLQAVKNTAQRSVDASQGKLTRQDLVEADLKLVSWLTDTFAGRNRHFETAEGWNRRAWHSICVKAWESGCVTFWAESCLTVITR